MLAQKLILPGVGSFDTGMRELASRRLIAPLHHRVIEEKVPVLGICLGAQLMTRGSEEGALPGLGWFDAETVRFRFDAIDSRLPIPNIGWRPVASHGENNLMRHWQGDIKFYFVHSYYIRSERPEDVAFTSEYGHEFAAGLMRENIFSTQFHPEKSHKYGMEIMSSFANV
jgi:glutamine amidotransferase